jgi:hypothetical protein
MTTELASLGVGGGGSSVTTLLLDHFTDTNGTNLTAHTMDIGPGWTVPSGTFSINSNQAKMTVAGYAESQANQSDVTISAGVTPQATNFAGLLARYSATTDYWRVTIAAGTTNNWKITEVSGGTTTDRATGSVTINSGTQYAVQAVLSGTNITATVNGGNSLSYGSASSNQTKTLHGLRGTSLNALWDDFQVTNP